MPGHYNKPTPPPPPKNPFDEQDTKNAAGKPLPGTGSKYKNGKKRDLGVGWGPQIQQPPMKKGKVNKDNKYYIFWGIMTISVLIGQIYVGLGYRTMAESIINLTNNADLLNVNSHIN